MGTPVLLGNKRTLHPKEQPVLTTEWDKEAGVLRGWHLGKDGQVEREEYGEKLSLISSYEILIWWKA